MANETKNGANEGRLLEIFELIADGKINEAKDLIPEDERHLPLSVHDALKLIPYTGNWPLLHFAVYKRCYEIVKYLLRGGADPEWRQTRVLIFIICLSPLFFLP